MQQKSSLFLVVFLILAAIIIIGGVTTFCIYSVSSNFTEQLPPIQVFNIQDDPSLHARMYDLMKADETFDVCWLDFQNDKFTSDADNCSLDYDISQTNFGFYPETHKLADGYYKIEVYLSYSITAIHSDTSIVHGDFPLASGTPHEVLAVFNYNSFSDDLQLRDVFYKTNP